MFLHNFPRRKDYKMKFKIVTDSSSDVLKLESVDFQSAPLKIITMEKEFTDDENLNVKDMVEFLSEYKGKSSTSCPNQNDWLNTFGDAERIFCITITATLSGSYNSAMLAKQMYEEMYPDRKVYVFNSLSTGPEMALIIDKIKELILAGTDYEEICEKIEEYSNHTGLIFVLQSMRNLSNNGRVSHLAARMAGILGIRAVGKASTKGDLEMLQKCRGEAKTLQCITEILKNEGLVSGRVKITHCLNEKTAYLLKEKILNSFPDVSIEIYASRGLCSFYAENGGMIIGFEKG